MRKRKTTEQAEALVMAVRTILKQPEKNAQRDPSKKGWGLLLLWKGGAPQAGLPSGI